MKLFHLSALLCSLTLDIKEVMKPFSSVQALYLCTGQGESTEVKTLQEW